MRARVFNIMQYEYHPIDAYDSNGDLLPNAKPLITEDIIKDALSHKTIKRWAYVWHDKDVYTEEEESLDKTGRVKAGELKKKHIHIVLHCPNAIELQSIASWFNIPDNFIDIPKGAGAFLDCVKYLTHEDEKQQLKGKHRYADDEVISNFDWRKELIAVNSRLMKYGKDLSPAKQMQQDVLRFGKTLDECYIEDPILYASEQRTLERLRTEYLNRQEPPTRRMNYYISGDGGVGKGILSHAFARALFPEMNPKDVVFQVGGDNVSFEGYDGQPVILWNDMRSSELLAVAGSRGVLFEIFDTFPRMTTRVHKKYGYVPLNHLVNIVNGPEHYKYFLDNLSGLYIDRYGQQQCSENKSQAYRRFPMIIPMREDDFDIFLNKGYMEGTREYEQYVQYANVRNNLSQLSEILATNPKELERLNRVAIEPAIQCNEVLQEKLDASNYSDDEVMEIISQTGQPYQQEWIEKESLKKCGIEVMTPEEIEDNERSRLLSLQREYNLWLDIWFREHETLRGTNNHPTFDWWLKHEKRFNKDLP